MIFKFRSIIIAEKYWKTLVVNYFEPKLEKHAYESKTILIISLLFLQHSKVYGAGKRKQALLSQRWL